MVGSKKEDVAHINMPPMSVAQNVASDCLADIRTRTQRGQFVERDEYHRAGIDGESAMDLLDKSLTCNDEDLTGVCLDFISMYTFEVIESVNFISASVQAMHRMLEVDVMTVREVLVWRSVLSWAVIKAKVATDDPRSWTPEERELIRPMLRTVLEPGRLRVLDVDALIYGKEIETTQVMDEEELIFKYRFDALKNEMTFMMNDEHRALTKMWSTHYSDKDELDKRYTLLEAMKRLRRRAVFLESKHPHESQALEQRDLVELPSWVQVVVVEFDTRTRLARGARLTIEHEDHDGTTKRLEYQDLFRYHTSRKTLAIAGHKLNISFSSESDASQYEWGYRIRFTAASLC